MENEEAPRQGKNYVFTWNNPSKDPEAAEELFRHFGYRFLVFQKERGEREGTEHYQGYVEFERQTRWSAINRRLPDGEAIWFARRRGSPQQARDYCRKPEGRLSGPFEWGELRDLQPGRRNDIHAFTEAVKSGKRARDLVDEFGTILAKYPRYYSTLQSLHMPILRADGVRVELSIGDTGVGKTRAVMEQYASDPGFFRAPIGTGFWMDGYDGQRLVLLDDFAGAASKIPLSHLLQILDRYPVQVPIKGGFTWWYPEEIIITTNIHPRDWYKWEKREEQYNALMRRFTIIKRNLRELDILERAQFKAWRPDPPPQEQTRFWP